MSLSDECVDYPTVIHELMHVIGFIHEHQRDDRDGFVNIVWENIINGKISIEKQNKDKPLYVFRS